GRWTAEVRPRGPLAPATRAARSRGGYPGCRCRLRQCLPGAVLDHVGQLVFTLGHSGAHVGAELADGQGQLTEATADLLADAGRGEPLCRLGRLAGGDDAGGDAQPEP